MLILHTRRSGSKDRRSRECVQRHKHPYRHRREKRFRIHRSKQRHRRGRRERERDGCGRLVQFPRVLTIHNAARQHLGMWNVATSRDFVHSQYNRMCIWGCRNFFLSTFFPQFSFFFFLFGFFSSGGGGGGPSPISQIEPLLKMK